MLRRLLVAAMLTVGLLAVISFGRQSAGRAVAAYGSAPRPVTAAWLYGVTATSSADAWAVGAFANADGSATLVEHWNGHTWKPMPSSLNLPENIDYLTGVAATSATNVWAAGTISSQYSFPLVDQWDGHKWIQDSTPTPGGDGGAAYLTGVAATSRKNAWAVGGYLPALAATDTLILRWKGNQWVQVPSPNPAGTGSAAVSLLQGVAALSPTDAWAVGEANTGQSSAPWTTVIEHWNGTRWATVSSPDPSRGGCVNDRLLGVVSRAVTWAVGSYCGAPLVLQLQGSHWRQVPSPRPRAGISEQLTSVAVTSKTNAWAVGNAARRILILHWNGTKWATVPAPDPIGAKSAFLAGVSAVSPSIAWAVGQAVYPHNVTKLLIERWNGTSWKLVSVPNPTL